MTRFALVLLTSAWLSGCGLKGDLYLEPPASAATPAVPAETTDAAATEPADDEAATD